MKEWTRLIGANGYNSSNEPTEAGTYEVRLEWYADESNFQNVLCVLSYDEEGAEWRLADGMGEISYSWNIAAWRKV